MPNSRASATNNKRKKSSTRIPFEEGSGNIFKDLGFPDHEANKKLLKCQLMLEIEKTVRANGWTQAQAAKQLGVVQPRISEIMTTRIDRFTLDTLLKYLYRLGKEVHITITNSEVA